MRLTGGTTLEHKNINSMLDSIKNMNKQDIKQIIKDMQFIIKKGAKNDVLKTKKRT